MAIRFPGELSAPYKPEETTPESVAVSSVGGVEKYGSVSGVPVTGYMPLTGGTFTGGVTMNTNLTFSSGGRNIILATTNGTKIGTATSQLLAFWNATPIVQPATGGAASTFTANTSGIANDTATWDSYTIGQVVKALRNVGLLA